jgi:uncharacterized membrane protein
LRAAGVLAVLSFMACSSGDGRAGRPDAAVVDGRCASLERVPTFAALQAGILPICLGCHSEQVTGDARNGAPELVNFDTYEQFANAAEMASYLVKNRLMPYPSGEGPTEEQRTELYDWAECGKPR